MTETQKAHEMVNAEARDALVDAAATMLAERMYSQHEEREKYEKWILGWLMDNEWWQHIIDDAQTMIEAEAVSIGLDKMEASYTN